MGSLRRALGVFIVALCPRCRQDVPQLLRPRADITMCPACWDLLLAIAAGDVDDVDAR